MEGAPAPASGGRSVRFWLLIVAAVLGLVFILVNSQEVEIDFIVGKATAPLFFALLITGFLGFVIGLILPRLRKRD